MQTPGPNGYQVQHPQPQSTPTPAQSASRRTTSAVATPTGSPNPADPYAHLTPEDLAKMNAELAEAEARYAPRFKEAEQHPDEAVRRQKIEGLRNSFGTKQSMIRKKYGVRLRERRTKAEIQAEKERLGIKRAERAEREKARAAMGTVTNVGGVSSSPAVKLEANVRPAGSSGWVAANTPRASTVWEEHDAKRRRMDEAGGYQTPYKSGADDTPTRKALTVEQIGGGFSATATAATHDPTLPPPQPNSTSEEAQAATQTLANGTPDRPNSASSGTPAGDSRQRPTAPLRAEPINIDDSSGSSDDDDIPPTLPPHAARGLTPHRGGATVMS